MRPNLNSFCDPLSTGLPLEVVVLPLVVRLRWLEPVGVYERRSCVHRYKVLQIAQEEIQQEAFAASVGAGNGHDRHLK